MMNRKDRCSRRKFLASAASAASLTFSGGLASAAEKADPPSETLPAPTVSGSRAAPPGKQGRLPLAVVTTVYRPMSHAYHIAGRFLHGYTRNGVRHVPRHAIASVCVDQTPENDLSRPLSRRFDFLATRSVEEALTLGGRDLAVAGVLLIGEHGNYPRNEKEQVLYPRFELMEQIVSVFRKTGKAVPVFCDKHLSYSYAKARQMYEWAVELKIPFMAGSSLPVTWRRPQLELPLGVPLEDGLVVAYGPLEIYGFHALEALQCMMERRKGHETGVKAVTCLRDKAVWKAGDDGRWSWDLLDAALNRSETANLGDPRENVGLTVQSFPGSPASAFLIEYGDGSRGTVLLLNGHLQDFCFAGRVKSQAEVPSCMYYLPPPPGARYFDALVGNIEKLLETGKPPYPVERTLLTTGVLDAVMESHARRGQRIETPALVFGYAAPADSGFVRGDVARGGDEVKGS